MQQLRILVGLLSWLNRIQLRVLAAASVFLVAVITVVIALGVVFRYGFNNSLSWTEELAKYAMLWLVFTGAPIALRLGMHPGIDLIGDRLSGIAGHLIKALVSLCVAAFCGYLAYKGHQFAWNGRSQVAITIGDLSMYWIFVSIPVGMASLFLVAVQQLFEHLLGCLNGGSAEPDPFLVQMQKVMDEQA
ncbi:MAG: TRAP transporter small permease [Quisquiliibacterium sp.]|jgi:TRAP-type C4-dicarboxylate transport system permease small subunit